MEQNGQNQELKGSGMNTKQLMLPVIFITFFSFCLTIIELILRNRLLSLHRCYLLTIIVRERRSDQSKRWLHVVEVRDFLINHFLRHFSRSAKVRSPIRTKREKRTANIDYWGGYNTICILYWKPKTIKYIALLCIFDKINQSLNNLKS